MHRIFYTHILNFYTSFTFKFSLEIYTVNQKTTTYSCRQLHEILIDFHILSMLDPAQNFLHNDHYISHHNLYRHCCTTFIGTCNTCVDMEFIFWATL